MKRLMYGALVVAAVSAAGIASAQDTKPTLEPVNATGLTFRAGGFVPIDSNLRHVSDTFVGVGLDYTFTHQFIANSDTYLSVDWFSKNFTGSKGNITPVCLNQRFYKGKSRYGAGRAYYFLGVGITFIDVADAKSTLGFRGGIGAELGPNIVAEVAGYTSGKDDGGVAATGVGVYLGYQFH